MKCMRYSSVRRSSSASAWSAAGCALASTARSRVFGACLVLILALGGAAAAGDPPAAEPALRPSLAYRVHYVRFNSPKGIEAVRLQNGFEFMFSPLPEGTSVVKGEDLNWRLRVGESDHAAIGFGLVTGMTEAREIIVGMPFGSFEGTIRLDDPTKSSIWGLVFAVPKSEGVARIVLSNGEVVTPAEGQRISLHLDSAPVGFTMERAKLKHFVPGARGTRP